MISADIAAPVEERDEFAEAENEAMESARAACLRAIEVAGIGRAELARRIGVDKSTINASLRAGRPGARAKSMALRSFVRILIACGVEPEFRIRDNEPDKPEEPADVVY